jgi:pimeloyl-ACP methyl ester carboxylesterase
MDSMGGMHAWMWGEMYPDLMDGIVPLGNHRVTVRHVDDDTPSPVVALNRAIAIAQNEGPERGLEEIRSITDRDRLAAYPFYPAALGELELRRGRHETARERFRAAIDSRATRWSAASSIGALARANAIRRSVGPAGRFARTMPFCSVASVNGASQNCFLRMRRRF